MASESRARSSEKGSTMAMAEVVAMADITITTITVLLTLACMDLLTWADRAVWAHLVQLHTTVCLLLPSTTTMVLPPHTTTAVPVGQSTEEAHMELDRMQVIQCTITMPTQRPMHMLSICTAQR